MNLRLSIPKSIPSIHLKINVLVRKGSVHSSTQSVKSQYNDSNDSMWTGVRLLVELELVMEAISHMDRWLRCLHAEWNATHPHYPFNEPFWMSCFTVHIKWRGLFEDALERRSLASIIQLTVRHSKTVSSSSFFSFEHFSFILAIKLTWILKL